MYFGSLTVFGKVLRLSISVKVNLFYTTCVTILLYGCESWVLSQDMKSKINSFSTSCYSIMLDFKQIYHDQIEPLVHCVRKRQLGLLGHTIIMLSDTISWQKETCTSTHLLSCLQQRVLWCNENEMAAEEIVPPLPKIDVSGETCNRCSVAKG